MLALVFFLIRQDTEIPTSSGSLYCDGKIMSVIFEENDGACVCQVVALSARVVTVRVSSLLSLPACRVCNL